MHELDEQLRELIPRLRRFAVSLTRNTSSADDLVQASLERAIISWADKRLEGDLRAWLFSILYRQFLDAHRRSRRYTRMLEFFTGRDDSQPSVERTVIAQSTLQAFDQLNTEQRALLLWVSVEGLSYKEVADILKREGFRAHADIRNEKLGFKVREAELSKVPYMVVVGEREAESRRALVHND